MRIGGGFYFKFDIPFKKAGLSASARDAWRRKHAELLFEVAGASALGFAKDAALSCFAVGRTSGLVLDLAACNTRAAAVVEGFVELKVSPHSRRMKEIDSRYF